MVATVHVAPALAHVPGTWRLLYFAAPTRGEQVRTLFGVAGVALNDVRLEPFPDGLTPYKKAAMGDASPLLGTDQCPAVTAPDGTHCVETSEIMRFVGQRIGFAPAADSAADATAMEACLLAQSVLDEVFYPLLKPMIVRQIFKCELFGALSFVPYLVVGRERTYLPQPSAKLRSALGQTEAALAASGGPYICGVECSYGDVALYSTLDEVLGFACFDRAALLAPHPKLAALLGDVGERAAGYTARRTSELHAGRRTAVEFLAATNTPFPWSRVAVPRGAKRGVGAE